MGQYNSRQDFTIEESSNHKNNDYYFNKQKMTKIPQKFYPTPPSIYWDAFTGLPKKELSDEEIFKTYLFL